MEQLKLDFEPEIQIIRFGLADIVRTSGMLDDDELPPWIIN